MPELFLQVRVNTRDGLVSVSRTVSWDAVPRAGETVLLQLAPGQGGARVQSVLWEDGTSARAQIDLEPQSVDASADDVVRDVERAGWLANRPVGTP